MSQVTPLPNRVDAVVANFRRRLDAEGMPVLWGLYLVGSVALDDFRPGASDIDFVAVLDREPTTTDCAALERVHAGLAEAGGACFDGFYLTAEALGRVPTQYATLPFSLDGRFRTGEVCREVNPVVWRCLARHGRTAFGPPPSELGIADDGDALRTYQIQNLREYWLSWISQAEAGLAAKAPGEDANAEALAWGVLGVARIACALETDGVVSKGGAGRHALAAHPTRWHPVIRGALAAHAGAIRRVPVETQGRNRCTIVSPSKPIPLPGSPEDKSTQPPHRQAANHHRRVVGDKLGTFMVTMDQTANPLKPLRFEIDRYGIGLVLAAPSVATAATSKPARQG